MSPMVRRLACAVVLGIMLSACGNLFGGAQPTPIGDGKAPGASGPGTPYPAPGTATTVAPTVPLPTAVPPAGTQPTTVPPAGGQSLVGPEWTLLATGDLNGDRRSDVVAIKLAQGVTPDATFRQPPFTSYKGPASEMVIVQAGDDGRPQIQAILTMSGLSAAGVGLASFSSPSAYMVNVTPGASPLVSIRAINSAGAPVGSTVGLVWSGGRYDLYRAPAGK